jgi:hypothetical protein
MSSCVVEVRDLSYFLGCWWLLCQTCKLRHVPTTSFANSYQIFKEAICLALENFFFRKKSKAVALPINCLGMLFYFCIFCISFLNFGILSLENCILFCLKNIPNEFKCTFSANSVEVRTICLHKFHFKVLKLEYKHQTFTWWFIVSCASGL